jgi:hypothetical protein
MPMQKSRWSSGLNFDFPNRAAKAPIIVRFEDRGLCSVSSRPSSDRLPRQHPNDNLWLQIVTWPEAMGSGELDGGVLRKIEAHSLSSVEYFAVLDVVDENLPVLRAGLNDEPHPFPFGFVPLALGHVVSIVVRSFRLQSQFGNAIDTRS